MHRPAPRRSRPAPTATRQQPTTCPRRRSSPGAARRRAETTRTANRPRLASDACGIAGKWTTRDGISPIGLDGDMPRLARRCLRIPRVSSSFCVSSTIAGLPHSIACEFSGDSATPHAPRDGRPRSPPESVPRAHPDAPRDSRSARTERSGVRVDDIRDDVAVRQFLRMANRVHEHGPLESRPCLVRPQHRQERADARPGGETPQHVGRRHFADTEKAVRARRKPDRIADGKRGKPRRQRPPAR